MLESKVLEIRDRGTLIPAIAIRLNPLTIKEYDYPREEFNLIRHAGFSEDGVDVVIYHLEDDYGTYDPFKQKSATMRDAHLYIRDHWNELKSGDVIDTEFIRGESTTPKKSEIN